MATSHKKEALLKHLRGRTPDMRGSLATSKVIAAIAALGLTVLAGCAQDGEAVPAPPAPPSGSPQSSAPETPSDGAPKVQKPIDSAAFEADPCSAISTQQLQSIGLQVKEAKPDLDPAIGPGCDWTIAGNAEGGSIGGTFQVENTGGLGSFYRDSQQGELGLFEEISPIEGQPAIAYGRKDDRNRGQCSVAVGLRDDLVYVASIGVSPKNPFRADPCSAGQQVATMAVQTLRGGS